MNASEEARLLSRVALQDAGAFRKLYELTSPRLFAIAVTMLGNRAQAEDLLQDVYVKIWYAADRFDGSRGEAMAWMVSIVRNRAIDQMRSRKQTVDEDVLSAEEAPPLSEDNQRLQECLDTLESQQRQSIFAAFFQGLSHSEIAARFAEPVGTIKSRVRRGLMSLKGCLES